MPSLNIASFTYAFLIIHGLTATRSWCMGHCIGTPQLAPLVEQEPV